MGIRPKNVREALCYEYAKLMADSAVERRQGLVPHARLGKKYWEFTTRAFRELLAGEISPSPILRENKMLVSSAHECGYCGAQGVLYWEHLFPISRGGPDTIDNLILACPPCNLQKGHLNPIDWYWKRGLDRRHIPRLVMGKCLKLVWEEHGKRGTLLNAEFPPGQGLSTERLFRVFDLSTGTPVSRLA